ncbi:MAG TPA: stage II sporulation protein M, partial [Pyrinomonadaceae bacterium]|nr:stage II sporulation protein M [Pyrinomonadaceae bacterium]
RYTATAFGVFALFSAIAFFGTRHDADFSEFAGVDPLWRAENIETHRHWWESANKANQIASSQIFTNNIRVTFYAFALGAMLGVGTLYVLAFNGANFGAIIALVYRAGFGNDLLLGFVVGHGVIELSCIFIAGGAGLLIGTSLLMPGDLSRGDALKSRGMEAVRLIVGCVPLLVVAGTIEGFISPQPISPVIKIGIGVLTGIALYSYLLLAGRGPSEE